MAVAALLFGLGACQSLPIDGPLASDVRAELENHQRVPFRLVELAPDMVPILEETAPDAESFITDLGPDEPHIGAGDVLVLTLVEPSAGGLYSGPPSVNNTGTEPGARVVTLPDLTVDPDGRIAVPFAGPIAVAGLTQIEAAARIQDALSGQAVQLQVIVNATRQVASRISVSGAVKNPGELPLRSGGETLLEAIARAGGATDQAENIIVQLTRFGHAHRVRLLTLLEQPEADIHVRGGDYLHLLVQPQHYYVMGATQQVELGDLTVDKVRLATALSKSGGLLDSRADARSVMLFRHEAPGVMDRIAAVEARLARARGENAPVPEAPPSRPSDAAAVPVIFMVDLRSASGLFMTQQLTLRAEDLVYVPDSAFTQWQKFLNLIQLTAAPVTTGAAANKNF